MVLWARPNGVSWYNGPHQKQWGIIWAAPDPVEYYGIKGHYQCGFMVLSAASPAALGDMGESGEII